MNIEKQMELENLYNKNQLISRVSEEFAPFSEFLSQNNIPEKFGISLLVQMALHKRTTLTILIGILRHHVGSGQEAADLIYKIAEMDLVDYNTEDRIFITKYTISDDLQLELDRYQFPLPMVIEPIEVKKNTDTGYVLGKGSLILRDNHHIDDICLDHINRLNKIKFTINHKTASMIQNSWRNLDKIKEGETANDLKKRKRAFEKYDRTARDIMSIMPEIIYLTHKYDKRGRTYCQGYHITYQGAPWNKAVLGLAEQEITQ